MKRHRPKSRAQSWPLPITFHLVPLDSYWIVTVSLFRSPVHSGEARGHACHAVHDQSFSELKVLFMKFHGQNAHKIKSYVL